MEIQLQHIRFWCYPCLIKIIHRKNVYLFQVFFFCFFLSFCLFSRNLLPGALLLAVLPAYVCWFNFLVIFDTFILKAPFPVLFGGYVWRETSQCKSEKRKLTDSVKMCFILTRPPFVWRLGKFETWIPWFKYFGELVFAEI